MYMYMWGSKVEVLSEIRVNGSRSTISTSCPEAVSLESSQNFDIGKNSLFPDTIRYISFTSSID